MNVFDSRILYQPFCMIAERRTFHYQVSFNPQFLKTTHSKFFVEANVKIALFYEIKVKKS